MHCVALFAQERVLLQRALQHLIRTVAIHCLSKYGSYDFLHVAYYHAYAIGGGSCEHYFLPEARDFGTAYRSAEVRA